MPAIKLNFLMAGMAIKLYSLMAGTAIELYSLMAGTAIKLYSLIAGTIEFVSLLLCRDKLDNSNKEYNKIILLTNNNKVKLSSEMNSTQKIT